MQERLLVVLAGLDPPWTLSGGGALAGFHTTHRETRDLDLFWQRRSDLGDVVDKVRGRLRNAGFNADVLQTQEAFTRLSVRDTAEVVTLDLVADPVPLAEAPQSVMVGSVTFLVDTPHQILVNKLCALLGRSEPRDVEDIKVLLETGGDLPRALEDCPRQDAGFSPMTLAWTARAMPLERLAGALGWSVERIQALAAFKEELVDRVLELARPES